MTLHSAVKKGELAFALGPMLAEWTGLEPVGPPYEAIVIIDESPMASHGIPGFGTRRALRRAELADHNASCADMMVPHELFKDFLSLRLPA